MTNEEFQTLMISELKKIHQRFDTIDTRLDSMDNRFDAIEARLDTIETRLDSMDSRFDTIDTRLDSMDSRFDTIDTRLDSMDSRFDTIDTRLEAIESQQRENTDFIKALLHQTEELNAKYDGLLNITVSNESFAKLETKIDIIAHQIIEHENDISFLRRAK